MTDIRDMTEGLRPHLGGNAGNTQVLKLDFIGAGFIRVAGAEVTNDDGPADCTIIVALDDFEKISKGDLDPAEAFQQGKLRIDGDIGVAMALQPFFAQAWS